MLKKLLKSDYLKNSLTLVIGIGLAQTIPVLLQPILRRMFTAEEFGVFAVYFSIVSTLAIVANFKYVQVVVIPKEDKTSLNLLSGTLILIALFSLLTFFVSFFWGEAIVDLTGITSSVKPWLLFVPLGVFFVSSSQVLNAWLTRKKSFKKIASNKLARRSSEGLAHLSFGGLKIPGGVILGSLVGDFVNFLVSVFQFKRTEGSFKEVSKKGMKSALLRYKEFPLYNLIPTLLDTISLFLPVLIISSTYSDEITGQYDLSRQILALPLALISMALSQVLLQHLSEKSTSKQPILPTIRRNFLGLALAGVFGILIFYPFSTPIFSFVFGEEWAKAGEITSILVFSYALKFAIMPLTVTFVAIEKIKITSIWQITYFGLISCLLLFDSISLNDFLLYYVLIDIGAYTLYFVLIYFAAKRHDDFLTVE
ncbi:MAG: lipopolysaccharide biosynthesis protein [Crocinitomicaceae bacterium]|nr:lipopolysaccharide biosynthesis protein [Crocinitomicaceae bacterium]